MPDEQLLTAEEIAELGIGGRYPVRSGQRIIGNLLYRRMVATLEDYVSLLATNDALLDVLATATAYWQAAGAYALDMTPEEWAAQDTDEVNTWKACCVLCGECPGEADA